MSRKAVIKNPEETQWLLKFAWLAYLLNSPNIHRRVTSETET